VWTLLLNQLKNPLIIILLVGAAFSMYTGHLVVAIAIGVIAIINLAISFVQKLNMQKSMDSLNEMASPAALVLRDGEWNKILAKTIVPGDILKLDVGSIVSADVRLVQATQLQMPRLAGVTKARCLLLGANTPWNRVRLALGLGTSAANTQA
jgi:Ca2+-transporting ATPase